MADYTFNDKVMLKPGTEGKNLTGELVSFIGRNTSDLIINTFIPVTVTLQVGSIESSDDAYFDINSGLVPDSGDILTLFEALSFQQDRFISFIQVRKATPLEILRYRKGIKK